MHVMMKFMMMQQSPKLNDDSIDELVTNVFNKESRVVVHCSFTYYYQKVHR